MIPPSPTDEQLSAWLTGDLDDPEAEQVTLRVESDPEVAARADAMADMLWRLAESVHEPIAAAVDEPIAAAAGVPIGAAVDEPTAAAAGEPLRGAVPRSAVGRSRPGRGARAPGPAPTGCSGSSPRWCC